MMTREWDPLAQGSRCGGGEHSHLENIARTNMCFFYKSTIFTVSTCKSYITSGIKEQ